jgi:hypothetical protein
MSLGAMALAASAVHADPRPVLPSTVGLTEVIRFNPSSGFVDDAIGTDGQRIAYAVSDAADKAELHVVKLATQEDTVIDVANVTAHPTAVELVGDRVLVIGEGSDARQVAALVAPGAAGKPARIVYRLGPATDIAVITRDGKTRVALHRAVPSKTTTRHEVELVAIDSGRTLSSGHALELDANNVDKQIDFHVNHWGDGMTRAFGLKGGAWDPKENQRTPDVEATYDLVARRFTDMQPIKDLFEQHKRFQTLADAGGKLDFVRFTWDNTAVQRWRAGRPESLELDQPVMSYDPKSLQGVVEPDGTAWFALQIDPVNPDAVARQKADPEYLDIFHVAADDKARRQGRVLATGKHFRFGRIDHDQVWLLERSPASDRGGKSLAVYRVGGN